MKKKEIVIVTPLNTMGFSYEREIDKNWLKARCAIMQQYTAKSLSAQTNKFFTWHILVREETKSFITKNFRMPTNLNGKIITVEKSDEAIKEIAEQCDDLLLTRLNSDDCYSSKFIQTVKDFNYAEDKQALVYQSGYMWYQEQNKVVKRHFASPPFYSFIYDSKKYLDGFRYDVAGHNHIRNTLNTHALREHLWLWLVNQYNNKILRGSSYPPAEDFEEVNKNILKEFGQ